MKKKGIIHRRGAEKDIHYSLKLKKINTQIFTAEAQRAQGNIFHESK